jgi:hypothetical protein
MLPIIKNINLILGFPLLIALALAESNKYGEIYILNEG